MSKSTYCLLLFLLKSFSVTLHNSVIDFMCEFVGYAIANNGKDCGMLHLLRISLNYVRDLQEMWPVLARTCRKSTFHLWQKLEMQNVNW